MTMTLVSTVTVGAGGAASIDFNSVPQSGTDLLIVVSARSTYATGSSDSLGIVLNSPGADTSYRWLRGNGSVAASGDGSGQNNFYAGEFPNAGTTSNTFCNYAIVIPNYTGSQQKTITSDGVSENNSTTAYQYISAGLCTKTAAITSIKIRSFGGSSNLTEYSTASLYTITKGSGGATVS